MVTFNDAAGREWRPALDFVRLRQIKQQTGVDLGNVEEMGRTWAELLYDDLKALDVVWLAIAGGDSGVPLDDWLAAMDGERLDAARHALKEAIFRFTQPLKRPVLRRGLEGVDETYRRALAEAEERVASETEAAIEQALCQARGSSAPSTPGGSAGSTTPGRSAKRGSRSKPNATTTGPG